MKAALSDLKTVVHFWAVLVFWRALKETARIVRRHVLKELIVAAVLFGLAFLLKEKSPFIDELKNSLFLLLLAAAIYGIAVFLWQFLEAPVRIKRELQEDRERVRREAEQERKKLLEETTAALKHAGRIRREYGSNIVPAPPSLEAIKRQFGTELRDIRHKIEVVKSTRPSPHYSHGFRLAAFRFEEYRERLAEDPRLYTIIEEAYTAAHHVNEALQMRETRAGQGVTIGVIPDDGLDAAYDAAGVALDALEEPRGEPWETGSQRAVRQVTEDVLADLEDQKTDANT
jgi:Na+-transporting methylmalonyl-CoA/oxaloacetate decarboxylase gamma subunit